MSLSHVALWDVCWGRRWRRREVFNRGVDRGGVSVYGGLISAVGFTSVNKSKITKVQNTIREPMGVMVISFPVSLQGKAVNVFKHGHIWPTEGHQRVCGWPPVLSHTQHIVVLHCKSLGARPDVTVPAFSSLLCAAARAVLLNVTFLKALFNHRWSAVDQAKSSVALAALTPKLAALQVSCEHTVFRDLGPVAVCAGAIKSRMSVGRRMVLTSRPDCPPGEIPSSQSECEGHSVSPWPHDHTEQFGICVA